MLLSYSNTTYVRCVRERNKKRERERSVEEKKLGPDGLR